MTLTLTFNDISELAEGMEEINRLIRAYGDLLKASTVAESMRVEAVKEPPAEKENSAPQAKEPKIPKTLDRADLRKRLTAINRRHAGNPAATIIQETTGAENFSAIKDEDLPKLLAGIEAKEAEDAG